MPKQVTLPGIGLVEFPDDVTDEQMDAALRADYPQAFARPKSTRYLELQREQAQLEAAPPAGFVRGFMAEEADALGNVARGAAGVATGTLKAGGTLADAARRKFGDIGSIQIGEGKESAFTAAGEGLAGQVEKLPQGDPDSFVSQVQTGIGQMGGMLAGGAAAKGVGLGARAAAGVASGLGFGQEFTDAHERSVARGDDPDTALAKSLGYATVATLIENTAGAGRIFRKYFPKPEQAAAALTRMGVSKEIAKNFLAGYGEEFSQRVAQDVIVEGQPDLAAANREGLVGSVVQGTVALPSAGIRPPQTPTPQTPNPRPQTPAPDTAPEFKPATPGTKPGRYAVFTGPQGQAIEIALEGITEDQAKELAFRLHPGATFNQVVEVAGEQGSGGVGGNPPAVGGVGYDQPIGPVNVRSGEMQGPPAPAVGRRGYDEPIGPSYPRETGEQSGPPERQRAPSPVVEDAPVTTAPPPTRAPVGSTEPETTAPFTPGQSVWVTLTAKGTKFHPAKVQSVDGNDVTVYLPRKKAYQTFPASQVQAPKSQTSRLQNTEELAELAPDVRKQVRADAKAFDALLIQEGHRFGHDLSQYPFASSDTKEQAVASTQALKRARAALFARLNAQNQSPDSLIARASLLPGLRQLVEDSMTPEEKVSNYLRGQTPQAEQINISDYPVGTEFKVAGEKYEIEEVDADTGEVTLRDGVRMKVDDGEIVNVDPGTVKAPEGAGSVDFPPPEIPTIPQLRPGEKGTSDLFQGEDAPFNLMGEQGLDTERIAREKAQKEADAKAAAEFAAKNQQDLFGAPPELPNSPESAAATLLDPDARPEQQAGAEIAADAATQRLGGLRVKPGPNAGQAGFTNLPAILADLLVAGARVLKRGGQWAMTRSQWVGTMIRQFGHRLARFLGNVWLQLQGIQRRVANRISAPTQDQVDLIESQSKRTNTANPVPVTAPVPDPRNPIVEALGTPSGKVLYHGGRALLNRQQEINLNEAYQASAVKRQSEALIDQLFQAGYDAATGFKLPAWMKTGAWATRVRDFKRRILHVAARLNTTGRNPDGSFAFDDFAMRAGMMTPRAFAAGQHNVGDTIVRSDPDTGIQETFTIGPLITPPDGRIGYQLYRSMPATTQAELYRHYADTYPELIWLLDMFIDPALKDVRQTINGVEVPVFNRFAQASMMADGDPNFTPLTAYTPDVLVSRSLLGAIRGALSFRAGTRSPGRRYKFGTSRESGYVRDLLTGFNVRTFQMLREESRRQWRQAVLAAAKPIPRGGVPAGWQKIETGMEELWTAAKRLRRWSSPVDPTTGDPLFPETEKRLTDDGSPEYRAFFGEAAALRGRQLMLPKPLVDTLLRKLAIETEHGALYRLDAWAIRNSTQLFLVHPVTYVANWGTNVLFEIEAMTRWGLQGLLSRDMANVRFAAAMASGMFTNRFASLRQWSGIGTQSPFLKAIDQVLPDQLFEGSTSLADVAVRWESSPWELLNQGEIGAAALQWIRYGNIDLRAKQRMAFAFLKSRAVQDARRAGLRGAAMRKAVQRYLANPPKGAVAQAVQVANFELLNYADTPEAIEAFSRADYGRLIMPFPRFGYHYITKQITRLRGLRLLLGQVPSGQRADAFADLVTVGLFGAGGAGVLAYTLMGLLGGDDDEDKDVRRMVGASTVPEVQPDGSVTYRPMDRALITANRINLSEWARTMGLGGEGEEDFWWRVRNYPVIAAAGATALAVNDARKYGVAAGARAFTSAAADLTSDFFSVGAALKVPSKLWAEWQSVGKSQKMPSPLDPYATYVPTAMYVTEQLIDSLVPGARQADELVAWIDNTPRRRTGSKTIGYEPGIMEGVRVGHWSGVVDRLGVQAGAWESLPPSGPIHRRSGTITPQPYTDTELMARIAGLNIRPINRDRYREEVRSR